MFLSPFDSHDAVLDFVFRSNFTVQLLYSEMIECQVGDRIWPSAGYGHAHGRRTV